MINRDELFENGFKNVTAATAKKIIKSILKDLEIKEEFSVTYDGNEFSKKFFTVYFDKDVVSNTFMIKIYLALKKGGYINSDCKKYGAWQQFAI